MLQTLRRHAPIVITAVVTATVFAAGPTVAQAAFDAVNSDKVDGKHAVGAGASITSRAGKLVATNGSGRLPNNILAKAPDSESLDGKDSTEFLGFADTASDSDMLDGQDSSAFAPTTHNHDDRYYSKGQAQARTAANSLNCVPGQYLRSVAADGTPTCVDAMTTSDGIAGPIGPKAASEAGNWQFAGPTARVTTTSGDTVLTSVSGVIGTTVTGARVDFTICRAALPDGVPTSLPNTQFMTTHLVVNQQEVISATFPSPPPRLPGTYDFGLCVRSNVALDANDWVNGAVTVFQGP